MKIILGLVFAACFITAAHSAVCVESDITPFAGSWYSGGKKALAVSDEGVLTLFSYTRNGVLEIHVTCSEKSGVRVGSFVMAAQFGGNDVSLCMVISKGKGNVQLYVEIPKAPKTPPYVVGGSQTVDDYCKDVTMAAITLTSTPSSD
ncbi:uncharacterized protein LOC135499284 [Lineus longissimus]|uniref:uncharacterized protein LOC135499284 n=1 Tax=Lineus longissimus TaxID=88925 RepID=UPI002B4E7771